MLVWQRPNLLLLDEPTNHLDLTTREALSMALNEFEGTVMLVSHDRALLREVCDEFWLVAGGARQALRRRPRRLPEVAARAVARGLQGARRRSRASCARTRHPKRKEDRKAAAAARQARADEAKPLKKELTLTDHRIARAVRRTRQARGLARRRRVDAGEAGRGRQAPEGGQRRDRAARSALARAEHPHRRDDGGAAERPAANPCARAGSITLHTI